MGASPGLLSLISLLLQVKGDRMGFSSSLCYFISGPPIKG